MPGESNPGDNTVIRDRQKYTAKQTFTDTVDFLNGTTFEDTVTINVTGTGTALDLVSGDIVGVDDIAFGTSGDPQQIKLPNESGAVVEVASVFSNQDVARFRDNGNIEAPNGKYSQGGNTVLDSTDQSVIESGTVTLSSGSAVVATTVSTGHIDVSLDPSGGGVNAADVKVSARAFWDNSAGVYKVEILEDGTSVGNPDVGYKVIQN